MTERPVHAVWVWRFTKAPYKATYGRLPGTTYSKDFLQAIGDCAEALDEILGRRPGEVVNIRFEWPGGSRNGSLFEAADYDENGRLDLRWETNNAPDPWRLFPEDDPNPLKTFAGDPTHATAVEADQEFEVFQARDLDPWLVAVKLLGEADMLHVRAYLGNPSSDLKHASAMMLPERVRAAMMRVPQKGGCAVSIEAPSAESGVAERFLFDPSRIHDAWSVMNMGAASFRVLVEERQVPEPAPPRSRRMSLMGPYRPVNTAVRTSATNVFTRDPDAVDRGLRAHRVTQETLAGFVTAAGLTPGSSVDRTCDYDLAWERGGMVFVAEVKSLTNQNERLQLRLGLGQVLEYAYRIRSEGRTVQPVIALEREPSEAMWVQVCEDLGVRLVWPDNMGTLF